MSVKVTVVGSINVDLVTQVARFPQPGETIIGGDLETIAGGKGANQAVAAARLGADVTMVGRVGDDVFASQLKTNLAAEGVDVTYVSASPDTASGVALILVDNTGQNIIVVASGANAKVTPNDVDRAAEAIASADVLLLQLEIPLESVHRAAQIAQEQGVKVVLNPAPAQPLAADLLSSINYLIPNESESSTLINALTGTAIDAPTDAPTGTAIDTPTGTAIDELSDLPAIGPEEMLTSMAKLRTIGVNTVILTAGEQGVFLAEAGSNRHFPAFSLDQVVDTTAAGDAFVGGLATAIAEGKPLSEAILWGNAAGMLAVTRAGAQPSLPSRAEVEALLVEATAEQRHGVRM